MDRENLGLPIALQTQIDESERRFLAWLEMLGTTREEFHEAVKESRRQDRRKHSANNQAGGQERRLFNV